MKRRAANKFKPKKSSKATTEAVELLTKWSASRESIELIWGFGHSSLVFAGRISELELAGYKDFMFTGNDVHSFLSPLLWDKVEVEKHEAFGDRICISGKQKHSWLTLQLKAARDIASSIKQAEDQFKSWAKTGSELMVKILGGFPTQIFVAKVSEFSSTVFGFKHESRSVSIVVPARCDRITVEEKSGNTTILMISDGRAIEVSDSPTSPESIMENFPLESLVIH